MKQGGYLTFSGTDRAIACANRRLVAFVTSPYTKGFNGATRRVNREPSGAAGKRVVPDRVEERKEGRYNPYEREDHDDQS